MYAQYREAKAKVGNAILLFRMGDFYEAFGPDAEHVSRICGAPLTIRHHGDNRMPMTGFPHHYLDQRIHQLIDAGHRVAVCDVL